MTGRLCLRGSRAGRLPLLLGVCAVVGLSGIVGRPAGGAVAGGNSRCGTVTVAQHVVKLGAQISATAARGSGWSSTCGAGWAWSAPAGPVSGCGADAGSCVFKAASITGSVGHPSSVEICIQGTGGLQWASCDDYEVLPVTISGTVSTVAANGSASPAAGVQVEVGGPGGADNHLATTNARGQYTVALTATGQHVVTAGQKFKPSAPGAKTVASDPHQELVDVEADVAGIDFSTGPASCALGTRQTASVAGLGGCGLTVQIAAPKKVRSGLTLHGIHDPESIVDFARSAPAGLQGRRFRCESGCADIVVKVYDKKTHQKVAGASVELRVTSGVTGTTGAVHVCAVDPQTGRTGECGSSSLLDLKTDDLGQAYARYWAPGVLQPVATTLQAHATSGAKSGFQDAPLTIEPYLIFEHSGPLSPDDVQELVNWGGGPSVFARFLSASTGLTVLHNYLHVLEHLEQATESQIELLEKLNLPWVKAVTGVLHVAELVLKVSELSEHWAMVGLFLENTDLSGTGLGDPSHAESEPAYPTYPFTKQLANYNGLIPGNAGSLIGKDYGEAGAWWNIATLLHHLSVENDPSVEPGKHDPWGLQLKVYEVSSCDPSARCDPGYDPDAGIDAQLHFVISLLYDGKVDTTGGYTYAFTAPYDAAAWAEAQERTDHPPLGVVAG